MVGKLCAGPKGGGSAAGLGEYLVGYAIAGKGATRQEIQSALDQVYAEAEERDDLGVGRVWSPTAGHGTRPSSILVRNCSSFLTASLEMDADAASNGGVRHSAMHFVWSFSTAESATLTDEQVYTYVGEVLDKIGLGDHRQQLVVHRDTLVGDADGKVIDGNLHVHAAIGTVDPRSGVAYDTTGIYRRMAWVEREVELAHGLQHDHGLAVVQHPYTPQAFVRAADRDELAAWGRQRREERLVALERCSYEGYQRRDRDFARFADATVAPRLRLAMDLARQRGREPDWATLHGVAARFGCALEAGEDGDVVLRDVGTGELRLAHDRERREARREMMAAVIDHEQMDARLAAMKAEHEKAEVLERDRKAREADVVLLDAVLADDRADMPAFQDLEQSEHAVAALVEARPEIVLRDLTAQSSTFERGDVDRWFAARISDPEAMERLGDLVVSHDSVRVLEVDTEHPLLTTTEILDVEQRLHDDASMLARRASGITAHDVEAAIASFERASSTDGKAFRLSDEQRAALGLLEHGSLTALEGLPGSGKTTIMSAVRTLADGQGRRVVGLTLSQAAAERLEDEALFTCVNTSRAAIMEDGGEEVIPQGGIVVVDEAGMVDSRTFARIVETAKARDCHVVAIGDRRQLQPVDAGAAWRIVTDDAKTVRAYAELRNIQRQKRDWHREAVANLADAIVERDQGKRLALVTAALRSLDEHGAITWTKDRDAAIDAAVTKTRSYQAAGISDVLMPAAAKDTVRHLAEEHRRREGREGAGRSYVTENGRRELAIGDGLMFLENSLSGKRALGVRNGDRGVVVEAAANRISVRMTDDHVVSFSPRAYREWDYAVSTSVHKTQGASVTACVPLLDRSASAELVFVAASRSTTALDMVVPQTEFRDIDDLAEHVAGRISLKTTTRTFDEILERSGGPDTVRVTRIERHREAENSPSRLDWQASVVEPLRAERERRIRELRASRDARPMELSASLSRRLEQRLAASRAFRSAVAEIHHATKPPSFSAWTKEQERAKERMRERQIGRSLTRSIDRSIDPDRSRQSRRGGPEIEHGRDDDYEIER